MRMGRKLALLAVAWLACMAGIAAVTQVDLTFQVKNILPVANGGTGIATSGTFFTTVNNGSSPFTSGGITTQNHTRIYAVYIDHIVPLNTFTYNVSVIDNSSNSYDACLYGTVPYPSGTLTSIPLVGHSGSTAGSTFASPLGLHSIAAASATTLSPGWYVFGFTSNAALPLLAIGISGNSIQLTPFATTTLATGTNACAATITAPSPVWALSASVFMASY